LTSPPTGSGPATTTASWSISTSEWNLLPADRSSAGKRGDRLADLDERRPVSLAEFVKPWILVVNCLVLVPADAPDDTCRLRRRRRGGCSAPRATGRAGFIRPGRSLGVLTVAI
jgi:hypothetical protein